MSDFFSWFLVFIQKKKLWDFKVAGAVVTAVSHTCTAANMAVNCTTIVVAATDTTGWYHLGDVFC